MYIADTFKDLRQRCGLSQYKLSKLSGVSQSIISGIESGAREPTVGVLERLCAGMGIELDTFFRYAKNSIDADPLLDVLISKSKSLSADQLQILVQLAEALVKQAQPAPEKPYTLQCSKHNRAVLMAVEGKAAAGPPIAALPEHDKRVSVPAKYKRDGYFLIQASGDSMMGAGINNGDYVIFNRDSYFDDGCIAYVQVAGMGDGPDGTIKRIYRREKEVELRSENPAYPPMIYPAGDVSLMGEMVKIIKL